MAKRYAGLAVLLWAGLLADWAFSAQVTALDFKAAGPSSVLTFEADGPITVDKQENAEDKQIVLDIKGAKLSKKVSRPLDTSSFDGSRVTLVSPYDVDGDGDASRMVIQLRDMASATVSQAGNKVTVSIPNSGSTAGADQTTGAGAAGGKGAAAGAGAAAAAGGAEGAAGAAAAAGAPGDPAIAPPADDAAAAGGGDSTVPGAPKTTLDQFVENSASKKFTGRPITLQVRDADIIDVFRLIGEASGFNIILGADVRGRITLSLVDVPWDQALDVILHMQRLGAERTNNILRIVTLDALTREKSAELQAKQVAEASAPRITRVFPINYASLGDLTSILTKFGTSAVAAASGPGGGAGSTAPVTTVVQSDTRTNSIIVRDIPENIERMKKLIDILDTQTPQVIIDSKVVEVDITKAKTLDGSFGFGSAGNTQYSFAAAGSAIGSLLGQVGSAVVTPATPLAAGQSQISYSPHLSILPGIQKINALLTFQEEEDITRIVSSPRVTVLNKESASIVQSQPVLVPTTTTTANGPVATTTVLSANLSLTATPTVTNEGSVLLDLNLSRDEPVTGVGVSSRSLKTKVLVPSGNTLVIGGIFSSNVGHAEGGVPVLRKIPIIGALFGHEDDNENRTEIFFFVTPRILNLKEAGLSNG